MKKKIIYLFFFFLILVLFRIFFFETEKKVEFKQKEKKSNLEETISKSTIINDVNYSSKDSKGNEYIVKATMGEIDYNKNNIIFLTNVTAYIKLNNKEVITVVSDFGKYNIENFDTIFSKNVVVNYLKNTIKSQYLDFSIKRNSMVITKNVNFTDIENDLNADVIEINLETRDVKISMFEKEKKVKIKKKN